MAAFLLRRVGYGFLTVLGVLLLLFVLFFAVTDPDDIARKAVGERARPEVYAQWKKNHGYDKPLFLNRGFAGGDARRYSDTLLAEHFRRMLTFDFGRSDADDSSISRRLREGAGPSLSLTVPLFILGLVAGISLALFVAFFRETYIDRAALVVCMLTMSVAGLLYIIGGQFLVGMLLKWFPISGYDPSPAVTARFVALPVLVGVVSGIGADVRFFRTIFIEEMSRDYVRTARAKGCGDARVMVRHVLRNALIPILTNVVLAIPFLFTGALLLESFFGIPGLGALTVEAIQGNDFSTLRTMVYLGALLFIVGQILTDISYAIADPRVRLGRMHWVSNVVVVLLAVGAVFVARHAARDRYWRENAIQLWRRRRLAIVVIGIYLFIALLDSISWVDPASDANALTSGKPRTIIDRVYKPESFAEASYSAPLASVTFYGGQPLAHPGAHLLGTDLLGRDVVYRTLKGARVALLIGGLTSLVVIPIALLFGVSAGYWGRRIDDAVFFAMTVLASVPSLLLLIALIMVLGKGTVQVCVALGVTGWVHFCRIARGETLKLREADFVAAARALGVSDAAIIRRHILPNIAHLIIITFALTFTGLVLSETILSYLGIGLDGSWGQMIDQARNELSRTPIIWWNLAGASIALFTLVLAVNTIADAMRDIIDPRTRREER